MFGRTLQSLAVAVVALAVASATASAQLCTGNAGFAARPMRVGVQAQIARNAKVYSAEGAAGMTSGVFVGANVGTVTYDSFDANAMTFGIDAGYSVAMNPEKSLEVCPIASFDFQSGPSTKTTGTSTDFSSNAFGLGGMIGGVLSSSADMQIIPFGGAAFKWYHSSSTVGSTSSSSSSTAKSGTIGAGIVVNKVWTIRPVIEFPLGDGGDPIYGIGLNLNFGSSH